MKLTLAYPVSPLHINQHFGENPQQYAQKLYGGIVGHNGMDFMAYHGQPIYAPHDGMAYYEYDGSQGEGVVLRTNQAFDYEGGECYFKSILWHMCDPIKEPKFTSPVYKAVGYQPDQNGVSQLGTPVKKGDLIGYADNTGASSGDHLHFGLKPVAQGESNGAWYNTEQNNGYNGAINPEPYFDGTFAYDPLQTAVKNAQSIVQEVVNINATPQQKSVWLGMIAQILERLKSLIR